MAVLNLIMMIFGYVTTIATIGFIFWLNIVDWREKRKTDKMMKEAREGDIVDRICRLEIDMEKLHDNVRLLTDAIIDYPNNDGKEDE